MKDRIFTPPFLIQMTSGEANQQCDKFPHGSFHEVKKDENGALWVTKGIDSIHPDYKTRVVENKPEIKVCPSCKNEFPMDWAFTKVRLNMTDLEETCVRCYERKYIPHNPGCSRDEYRQLIREELKREQQ